MNEDWQVHEYLNLQINMTKNIAKKMEKGKKFTQNLRLTGAIMLFTVRTRVLVSKRVIYVISQGRTRLKRAVIFIGRRLDTIPSNKNFFHCAFSHKSPTFVHAAVPLFQRVTTQPNGNRFHRLHASTYRKEHAIHEEVSSVTGLFFSRDLIPRKVCDRRD